MSLPMNAAWHHLPMPQDQQLPRPSGREWLGLATGLAILVFGLWLNGVTSTPMGRVVAIVGIALTLVIAWRVRTRRLNAMRTRRPS